MAEGWARALHAESLEAYSAGVETHGLNPTAVRVMQEAGVDISGQRSQHVDEFRDLQPDLVVTVCEERMRRFSRSSAACAIRSATLSGASRSC
jgi:arsenate reductase